MEQTGFDLAARVEQMRLTEAHCRLYRRSSFDRPHPREGSDLRAANAHLRRRRGNVGLVARMAGTLARLMS